MAYQEIVSEPIFVMSDDKLIYRVTKFRQVYSNEHQFLYQLKLVGGYDYVNPDESDTQGIVGADRFTSSVQLEEIVVDVLNSSLKERLSEERYEIINMDDYTIHP